MRSIVITGQDIIDGVMKADSNYHQLTMIGGRLVMMMMNIHTTLDTQARTIRTRARTITTSHSQTIRTRSHTIGTRFHTTETYTHIIMTEICAPTTGPQTRTVTKTRSHTIIKTHSRTTEEEITVKVNHIIDRLQEHQDNDNHMKTRLRVVHPPSIKF